MSDDIAIRVENLGKMYRIGVESRRPDNVWQAAQQLVASPFEYLRRITRLPTEEETLWALKDVSFEVKRGEVVGVPATSLAPLGTGCPGQGSGGDQWAKRVKAR